MREILFRGKRTSNGEWVEGWYEPPVKWDGHSFGTTIAYICSEGYLDDAEVDPTTVGQYTGLQDKNGKRIFEGDILVFCKGATHPIQVYWDGLGWKFLRNEKRIEDTFECNTISHIQYCEIIGNIHDNPELLEVQSEDGRRC